MGASPEGEYHVGINTRMDGLTGFLDRGECIGEVERLAGEARTAGASFSVIWIGIDRFRQINSSFGHKAGDNVLAKLAHRMKSLAGEDDLLGRLGGDEFVMLLPGRDLSAAESAADRIQEALKVPMEIGQVRFRPSGSIGIAQLNAEGAAHIID